MKKTLIILAVVLFGQVQNSLSQLENEIQNSIVDNSLSSFEGMYSYEVNSNKYAISLSSQNEAFIEYNANGTIISSGSFEKTGENTYTLIPSTSSYGTNISDTINVTIDASTGNQKTVHVYDNSNQFIQEIVIKRKE